jgi:LysR family glycine cleavage system transcriptional activator
VRIPNLNTLRAFEAAARHLNFRLAAEELLVTQSAVAQQVRRLEEEIGARLFERHPRGLHLTDAGRRYYGPLQKAFTLIETATEALRPAQHQIRLSVPPTLATKWLNARLAGFETANPDLEIQVIATEQRSNFQTDGVTLAIRQGRDPATADLDAQLLSPIRLTAVASPAMASQIGLVTSPADLIQWPMIQDSHRYWDELLPEPDLSGGRRQQFNQTALCLDAAAKGRGLAIAPSLVVADDVAAGTLFPVWTWDPVDSSGFYLIHPTSRKQGQAARIVTDWLLRELAATSATADGGP